MLGHSSPRLVTLPRSAGIPAGSWASSPRLSCFQLVVSNSRQDGDLPAGSQRYGLRTLWMMQASAGAAITADIPHVHSSGTARPTG